MLAALFVVRGSKLRDSLSMYQCT